MNTRNLVFFAGIAFGTLGSLGAQEEFIVTQPDEIPVRPMPVAPGKRPTVDGIVAEIFKNRQPWQLVNPLAPKAMGNGRETVSWDPNDEGKPKGFIVFGIRF